MPTTISCVTAQTQDQHRPARARHREASRFRGQHRAVCRGITRSSRWGRARRASNLLWRGQEPREGSPIPHPFPFFPFAAAGAAAAQLGSCVAWQRGRLRHRRGAGGARRCWGGPRGGGTAVSAGPRSEGSKRARWPRAGAGASPGAGSVMPRWPGRVVGLAGRDALVPPGDTVCGGSAAPRLPTVGGGSERTVRCGSGRSKHPAAL